MRSVVRLAFFIAVVLLFAPFFFSSRALDAKGRLIEGQIVSKDESILVHYPFWTRRMDLDIRYSMPSGYGVSFLGEQAPQDEFDRCKVGDRVTLRYLNPEDVPPLPGARIMREMRLLPFVRLASHNSTSGLFRLIADHRVLVTAAISTVLTLFLWRLLRLPGFTWLVASVVLIALALSFVAEFPRPLPAPTEDLRTAAGRIKSLDRWEWLFRDNHSRGVPVEQVVEVASVEFVPLGRSEPVVAVDLIDSGSLPNLHTGAAVLVDYEAAVPRKAYLQGATRRFARKNLEGLAFQAVFAMILLIAVWIGSILFGRLYRRLTYSSAVH